jgi:hypothetical protein
VGFDAVPNLIERPVGRKLDLVGCTNSIFPAKTPIQPPQLTSPRTGRITPKNSEVDRGDALGLSGEACAVCVAAMRLAPVSNMLGGSECSHFAATPSDRLLVGQRKPLICGAF